MDGFLLVDKPENMTSQTLCTKIKRQFKLDKIGHNGTLDPNTTGLMIVACNRATKLLQYLENQDKTYITTIQFGILTDTLDIYGKILKEVEMNFSKEDLISSLEILNKKETQIPPIVSAIKVNGKKLMNYHLKGEEVEIKERNTKIIDYEILSDLEYVDSHYEITIKLHVTKGYYVRSFARDLGHLLNGEASMKKLRRIKSGNYDVSDSKKLDDILNNELELLKIDDIFKYKVINVNERILNFVKNGVTLYDFNLEKDCKYKDYKNLDRFYLDYNNSHLAIYERVDEVFKPIFIFR